MMKYCYKCRKIISPLEKIIIDYSFDESERYLMSHHLLTNEQRLDKKQKKQIEKAKKAEKAVTLSERCG